ncbi:MAG: AraC family transcriptional regulator, partial [Parabacteroides sp.]|nr:AraC family transcriptional regulator [Parabacteroides sp.]
MKAFYLFLLIFIYVSCTNQIEEKTDLLEKKLEVTPILSLSFDSLLQEVRKLPIRQQIKIVYQAACKNGEEIDGLIKQKNLLLESLSFASKKEKKKILLRLLELYERLAEQRWEDSDSKGIQLSKELETNYSFSQEEEWEIRKIKASLLSKRGLHEQYLPIWFELLAEHRIADNPKLIIEDIFAIANYFAILGDQEKSISLYKEAYELIIENHLPDLTQQCLVRLIYLFYNTQQYEEVVKYTNEIELDSMVSFMPPVYSILSLSYLELQTPDSARFCLIKMNHGLKEGNGMSINCRIADTYIAEKNIDSALVFLNKAMTQFNNQVEQLQKRSIKTSLPFNFLSTYSSLATLYQQNENYEQAVKLFALVEPLMKISITNPVQLEKQVDALIRYSSFCRATKQYEKA